jgi:phosphatidylinositol dimannoside acyltransferase
MAFLAGAAVAGALPTGMVRRLAGLTGVAAGAIPSSGMAVRRDLVARHLRRVCGPSLNGRALRAGVDQAFASYARYWAESLRLPRLDFAEVDAGMSWEGVFHLEDALQTGRGAILAMPHLGGWEWAGLWLTLQGYPVTAVVEALQPPELFDWFVGFRRSLGMNIVAVGPDAGTAVLSALRANHIVCLLCDRNVGGTPGVQVEFFGEQTGLPGGPATLALRTGARILPSAAYFSDRHGGHLGLVRAPLDTSRAGGGMRQDVLRVTQALAGELEYLIRRAPTQWHLMQPNWPSDPGYRDKCRSDGRSPA